MPSRESLTTSPSNPEKVTLVIWRAHPGGIETALFNYLEHLKSEIDFTIYSLRKIEAEKNLYGGCGVDMLYGHDSNMVMYIKFLRYARKNRNRIFHLFDSGPVLLLFLRYMGIRKIIYHIHGTVFWKSRMQKILGKFFWFLFFRKQPSEKNVCLLVNSDFTGKEFKTHVSPNADIKTLYNPINDRVFTPAAKTKSTGLRIIYVGRLVPGKNLFLWVDLARHILQHLPDTRFKIVGDGALYPDLLNRIKEYGLENSIELTGYMENIQTLYQNSDLLLFLSEHESFGNVVVESMLCGTPVIASAIPAMREIFRDYPEFLVNLDSRLFETIVKKLHDFKQLSQSAVKARTAFAERFGVRKHIEQIRSLYLES